MATRKATQTTASKIERLRAATDRARAKSATESGEKVDIARVPLAWWRARWSDPKVRKQFIENFIYVRNSFDENKVCLFKFNDAQNDFIFAGQRRMLSANVVRSEYPNIFWPRISPTLVLSGRRVRPVPHDPDTEDEFRTDIDLMIEICLRT
jgi:hypothetical protein